jgi:hypothetical protein
VAIPLGAVVWHRDVTHSLATGGSNAATARPRRCSSALWTERWRAPDEWSRALEAALRAHRAPPRRGTEFDPSDLEVRANGPGGARLQLAVEEHGAGVEDVWIVAGTLGLAASAVTALFLRSSPGATGSLIAGVHEVVSHFEHCTNCAVHDNVPPAISG